MNETKKFLLLGLLAASLGALPACGSSSSSTNPGGTDPGGTNPGGTDPGGTNPGGGALACNGCHGGADNAAPPKALNGATATTDLAVGAHQAHLKDGAVSKAVACGECHPVPTSASSAGHQDGKVDVVFGSLAKTGGASPTWSASAATCTNVYCHTGTHGGGAASAPVWNKVDGSQAQCGSCHGNPPTAGGHPQVTAAYCSGCHPDTVNDDGSINVAGGKHIDGTVQQTAFSHPTTWMSGHQPVALADHAAGCKPCHGSDLAGGTSGVPCSRCHGATTPWL